MNIAVKIDASGLNRALSLAQQYTKRTPAQAVNTTACEIAINAKYAMPFASMTRIDSELAVIKVPRIGKRGKPLKKSPDYKGGIGGSSRTAGVPLSVLIIQARARRGSNYNLRTNSRYFSPSPFKGVSPAAGRAAMRAAESRLIKARHSSPKFLMAGWIPVIQKLLPYSVNRYRRGSATGQPLEGQRNFYGADLGSAIPAQAGAERAVCVIENNIGYRGKNAASFNRALWLHGARPLQRAIDDEGAKNMQYFLDKSAKEELERPFNQAAG